jgi:hypothetical protein
LEDAQQCQVVGYVPLVCSSADVIANSPPECFDCVLGIVVIPSLLSGDFVIKVFNYLI